MTKITTIAVNQKEMSGDLMYSNEVQKFKGAPKLIRVAPHEAHWPHGEFIVGFAGVAAEMIALQDFYLNPENSNGKMPRTRSTKGLILTGEGIYYFDHPGTWMRVKDPFFAIGSGSSVALGAMHAGADTKLAIKAAGKVDPFTGFGVKTLTL